MLCRLVSEMNIFDSVSCTLEEALQAHSVLLRFLLNHIVLLDMQTGNGDSTYLETLQENIRNSPELSDNARKVCQRFVYDAQLSLKAAFESRMKTPD
jgi:hypothetical protein